MAEKKSFDMTQVLSIEDIIKMIKATSNTRDRAILFLLYKTEMTYRAFSKRLGMKLPLICVLMQRVCPSQ
jgi:hypothetical protein